MRGCIRKNVNKNGVSYTIVVPMGKDPNSGKYKQKWVTVKTRKEAELKRAKIIQEMETGAFVEPGKVTVGEFLDRWLKDYAKPKTGPRTYEGYEYIVRVHLKPVLGAILLKQLKPDRIQKYYAEKLEHGRCNGKGGLSAKSVRHHHVTLHDALESAVKWGLLSRNPADACSPPSLQRREIHIMNEEQVRCFLEAAKVNRYFPAFYTALFTGMRRSELLALRWSDVDLMLMRVSINKSMHQLRDGSIIFRQPKSAKGRRTIALPPSAALALKAHREKQIAERLMLGGKVTDDDLVFSELNGSPVIPDHVTQAWRRLAKKTGHSGVTLHGARHTFASIMLKNNIHPAVVQQMLGHSSIQVTIDTYSHILPGLQEAAAKKLDSLLTLPDEAKIAPHTN